MHLTGLTQYLPPAASRVARKIVKKSSEERKTVQFPTSPAGNAPFRPSVSPHIPKRWEQRIGLGITASLLTHPRILFILLHFVAGRGHFHKECRRAGTRRVSARSHQSRHTRRGPVESEGRPVYARTMLTVPVYVAGAAPIGTAREIRLAIHFNRVCRCGGICRLPPVRRLRY